MANVCLPGSEIVAHAKTLAARSLLHWSGRVLGPLDAVEDEIEPVLEFVAIVVPGLHGAVDRHFGQVGVLAGAEPLDDVARHPGAVPWLAQGQGSLGDRESVDV